MEGDEMSEMDGINESIVKETKRQVFQMLFEKKVLRHRDSRDGQSVETSLNFKDGRLVIHYEKMLKTYGGKKGWEDIQSEYVMQSYLAIESFEIQDVPEIVGWDSILHGSSELQMNRLLKYIQTTVGHRMHEFANPEAFRTSTTVNGERVNYTLLMEIESLDSLLNETPESVAPIQLHNGNNLFSDEEHDYHVSSFQTWFEENREKILTKSQAKFLDDVKRLSNDDYLTQEEFEEVTGVRWDSRSKRLKRIEGRIEKAWIKEEETKDQPKKKAYTGRLKYMMDFMQLVEDDSDPMTQNIRLTDFLVAGMNDKQMESLLFKVTNKAWSGQELILFNQLANSANSNRVALKTASLIKVIDLIALELKFLLVEREKMDVYDIKEVKNEVAGDHLDLNPMVKTAPSTVKTYNMDNKLLKEEVMYIEVDDSPKNVFTILPGGAYAKKE